MAYLIPNNLATSSEVRRSVQDIARLLRDELDDDVTVILDIRDPDSALWIVDPQSGAMALQVLDGGKRSLQSRLKSLLNRNVSTREVLEAVAEEAGPIAQRLRQSKHLARDVPVGSAVAMPAVSNADIERTGYDLTQIVAKDDLKPDRIRAAIQRVTGSSGLPRLTAKEEKVVRAAITPEIVIRDRYEDPDRVGKIAFRAPDLEGDEDVLAVLDRGQQQLAMHLPDGYRVIRGVAGSGKSVVLTHRARWLAENNPDLRILVTCYNVVIGKALAAEVAGSPNVDVLHLDSLAYRVCSQAGTKVSGTGDEKWVKQRKTATSILSEGKSPYRYDTVLVDEGQDFDSEMFDLAFSALRDPDQDFVIALDAAQNIYRKKSRWNPPGMTARGRSTVLQVNYRNTREILEVAYDMLMAGGAHETSQDADLDDPSVVVHPEASSRRGAPPRVVSAKDRDAEVRAICDQLQAWHDDGVAWHEMLLLFGNSKKYQGSFYYECQRRGIPYVCLSFNGKQKRKALEVGDVVRSSTVQTVKGVEFSHVAICGVNDMIAGPREDNDEVAQRRMLYVGMTRATDHLFVTVSEDGPIGADLLRR